MNSVPSMMQGKTNIQDEANLQDTTEETEDLSSLSFYSIAPGMRQKLRLAIAIPVFFICLGIVAGVLSGNRIVLFVSSGLSLVVTPICIGLVQKLRSTRLGVGENGLKLQGALGSDVLDIAWADIERLHIDARYQGLVMREPLEHPATQGMVRGAQVRVQSSSGTEKVQAELVATQRWIPFESFAGWFVSGSLTEEFRKHAPRLAEDFDRVSEEFAKALERQRIAMLVGCSIASVLLLLLLVAAFFSGIVTPTGQAITWSNFLQLVFSATLSILSLFLAPVLAYFAFANLRAAYGEWRQKDLGAAMTCVLLAALQVGFAFWIVSSIVMGKRS